MKVHQTKKGFSIGEVLLSMFVLVIGIMGVMELSTKNIRVLADSRDIIVASQFAQEGVELSRNLRDNNVARGVAIFTGMGNGRTCAIDYSSPITCLSPSSFALERNTVDGFFRRSTGEQKFKRKITFAITNPGNDSSARNLVTSYVWWGNTVPNTTSACIPKNNCVFAQTTMTTWILGEE